jgi:hypothetical protein
VHAARVRGPEGSLGARRDLGRLDEVLLGGALVRDEQAAVRALEAPLSMLLGSEELTAELFLAMGTDDLVRGGGGGHPA